MATITYLPESGNHTWDDPNVWSDGVVPNDPADAVLIYGLGYSYGSDTLAIEGGESYTIGSLLDDGESLDIQSGGTLAVGGGVSLGDSGTIATVDGTLSANSLVAATNSVLSGFGVVAVSGQATLNGLTVGSGLVLDANSLANSGRITGTITVNTPAGGFLAGGVFSGGELVADTGDVLRFDTGALLTTDAGTIEFGGGTIESLDPVTGGYLPIQSTMTSIAASGTLDVSSDTTWGNLTVAGSLSAPSFAANSLTILAGGVIYDAFSLSTTGGPILNNGSIETEGAAFTCASALAGTGTLIVSPFEFPSYYSPPPTPNFIDVELGGACSNTVDLLAGDVQLELRQPTLFTGSIAGFPTMATAGSPTSFVLLDGIHYAEVTSVTYSGDTQGGTLTITAGPQVAQLRFTGDYTVADFQLFDGEYGDTGVTTAGATVPCFAAGTLIATPAGPRPVEHLRAGDPVRTADGQARPIVWAGRRHVDLAAHPDPALARPVVIRAGAFAPGIPARDLRVSPDHNIAVADVLIPAKCLVNGTSVVIDHTARAVTYHHVELATHDLLLAEGLVAESYLDTGNRAALQPDAFDAADFSSAPDLQWAAWEALGCRRLVLFGPEFDAARAALDARERERLAPARRAA